MNIEGKIIELFDTQKIKDSFQKREFVVEYKDNPQYPEVLKFELIQDKCGLLDAFKVGDDVDVHFNLKGRKWSKDGRDMYFTTLQAWRLEAKNAAPTGGESTPDAAGNTPSEPEWLSNSDEEGDLPF